MVHLVKTKARQIAGKRKAGSLKAWQADFKQVCDQQKSEGYIGSLKIKKGMPVYARMQELKQGRLLADSSEPASAASGASGNVGEHFTLHRDTVPEAPPDLRVRAKRGDAGIEIR